MQSIFVALLICLQPPVAQEKTARELETEIAEVELKLKDLKAELAKIKPTQKIKRSTVQEFVVYQLKVGQIGKFSYSDRAGERFHTFKVKEIVSKKEMILYHPKNVSIKFVMVGMPTTELADEAELTLTGVYKVTGTKKIYGATYLTVEEIPEASLTR